MKSLMVFMAATITAFGTSHWMDDQIKEDLSAFAVEGFSRSDMSQVMRGKTARDKEANLVHIEIKGSEIFVKSFLTGGAPGTDFRLNEVVGALRKWQRFARALPSKRLPDTEFLLSVNDEINAAVYEALRSHMSRPIPIFVFCKEKSRKELVLFPDCGALAGRGRTIQSVKRGDWSYPWKRKKETLFWRGAASDGLYDLKGWRTFPRAKLVLLGQENPDKINAGFTLIPQAKSKAALDSIMNAVGLSSYVTPREHVQYKYLMDIDGQSNGWDRCFWGLLCTSTLFKQKSLYSQWYYKALVPWRHYVPINRDLSDIHEKLEWAKNHDREARVIAESGREIAGEIFKRSAVFEYVRRLLIEYNKLP